MKRPNILLIYTDQQRWDALGVNGNKEILTPNLDHLAAQGTNFTHHFVQNPVCMPSRISMLSGQYPSTLGITHMGVPVPKDTMILPHILKPYGYHSANIGKLHFLPHANRDHTVPYPTYGFDHIEISDEPGPYEDAYRAWGKAKKPNDLEYLSVGLPPNADVWQKLMEIDDPVPHRVSGQRSDYDGAIPFAGDDDMTHSAFVAEQTIEFLRQQNQHRPFLCIAGFYSPHAPLVVPQKYLDLYDRDMLTLPCYTELQNEQRLSNPSELFSDANLRSVKHGYYAMISEVDYYVGEICKTLTDCGLDKNTIIIFTSDHGDWLGDHLRYAKGYPADDAVSRVPLIISVPNAPIYHNYSGIVESVDIVPTILSLVGIQIPPHLQGKSLRDVVFGIQLEQDSSQVALTEGNGWKNLRTDRYRYLVHEDGSEKLWDIEFDPCENIEVAQNPEYRDAIHLCRHMLIQKLLRMERPKARTWTY